MTQRASPEDLDAATSSITEMALVSAKSALEFGCMEFIHWAELFAERLEKVEDIELQKFARAFSLCLLGQLPTRPETCPFCTQYGKDRKCIGCGYALIHGSCEAENSAFTQFIEAFQEFGKAIYQETGILSHSPELARSSLGRSIYASSEASREMLKEVGKASALRFMELKAHYIDQMISLIPRDFFSEEVNVKFSFLKEKLKDYW
jgi:hypothetical protein